MLFTRCPDCDTTFRVTDDALKKANGQVRCGRCSSVFNAYAERREVPIEASAGHAPERPTAETSAVQPKPDVRAEQELAEPAPGPAPAAPPASIDGVRPERLAPRPVPTEPVRSEASAPRPVPTESVRSEAPAPRPVSTELVRPEAPAPRPVPTEPVRSEALAPLPVPAEPARPEAPAPRAVPTEPVRSEAPATLPVPAEPVRSEAPAASNPPLRLVSPSLLEEQPASEPDDDPLGGLSVESVVAQLEQGAADPAVDVDELGDLEPVPLDALPPAQVEAVLETEPVGNWRHALDESPRSSRWWSVGVACGVALLALQLLNHYRAELVKQPSIGSLVQNAYASLGIIVLPRWDVRQYQILDWVATAEPSSGGIGSLRITARIKNLGPEYQPYPDVNLRLKDRWDAAVGGRVFAPAEYLAAAPRKLMAPGETARAQLELVDPGPDAYGFDLDVCVEVETHVLSCRNDKVFL